MISINRLTVKQKIPFEINEKTFLHQIPTEFVNISVSFVELSIEITNQCLSVYIRPVEEWLNRFIWEIQVSTIDVDVHAFRCAYVGVFNSFGIKITQFWKRAYQR